MTWLLRTRDESLPVHRCDPPMVDVTMALPFGGVVSTVGCATERVKVAERPGGAAGDLWACDDCGAVWKVTPAPPNRPGGGFSSRGDCWQELPPRAAKRAMRRALWGAL